MRKQKDRQFGDFRLIPAGTSHSAQRWRIVPATGSNHREGPAPTTSEGSDSLRIEDLIIRRPAPLRIDEHGMVDTTSPTLPNPPECGGNGMRTGELGELPRVGRTDSQVKLQAPSENPTAPIGADPSKRPFPFPTQAVERLRSIGHSDAEIRAMPTEKSLELLIASGLTSIS